MLTRKDYVTIADILESFSLEINQIIFEDLVEDIADYCASDNPNFDYEKFREACGIVKVSA
jgi:hypothetical protein